MRNWGALKERIQHSIIKHHLVFSVMMVIEQIKIQHRVPLFKVKEVQKLLIAWE